MVCWEHSLNDRLVVTVGVDSVESAGVLAHSGGAVPARFRGSI